MRTLLISYNSQTGVISSGDIPSATVNDNNSVLVRVEGLPEDILQASLLYGIRVKAKDGKTFYPFSELTDGETTIPNTVLSQCNSGKLPISVKVLYSDQTVEQSVNYLTLRVETLPDGEREMMDSFPDEIMTRGKAWEWIDSWTYSKGAVATHEGYIYVSIEDNNRGEVPGESPYWVAAKGGEGPQGPQGIQGEKGDKGDAPRISFRYDSLTGNLYYSIDYGSSPDVPVDPEISEYAVYFTDESGNTGLILADGEPVLYELI